MGSGPLPPPKPEVKRRRRLFLRLGATGGGPAPARRRVCHGRASAVPVSWWRGVAWGGFPSSGEGGLGDEYGGERWWAPRDAGFACSGGKAGGRLAVPGKEVSLGREPLLPGLNAGTGRRTRAFPLGSGAGERVCGC